jgi:hypothetical protein
VAKSEEVEEVATNETVAEEVAPAETKPTYKKGDAIKYLGVKGLEKL